ncbi:MAG: DNA mismatch repair protein MutS [Vampirovibrio sp.]|nr:DNA mismatch repair protein MutS [Vampirovibrio sp.]
MATDNKNHNTLYSFGVNPDDSTPMVRQFLGVKQEYPGIILFYRMGDFYETFFEDAVICARVLEITLTGRDAGKLGRIPMAGIPVKAAETYLSKLLSQNFKVAVCEQTEDPSLAKGLVERQVVRVLSSGTVTEQSLLKPEENNFLAAAVFPKKPGLPCGLAYCDITTGEFFATELDLSQLLNELDRIRPTELLVKGKIKKAAPGAGIDETVPDVPLELSDQYQCTPLSVLAFAASDTTLVLQEMLNVSNLEGYGLQETPAALTAAGAIGYYLRQTFIQDLPTFDGIRLYRLSQTMLLNSAARRNLELLVTAKSGHYEGSLLWVLNKTCTSMGSRLLRQWISQPLTHLPEITSRQQSVEELVNAPTVRGEVRQALPDVYDMERLSTKVGNLTAQPRDLVALKLSIAKLPGISNLLAGMQSFHLSRMQQFPPELFKVTALIDQAVDESPGLNLKEGGIIKTGYNQELDRLRKTMAGHETWLKQYEQEQRERTGVKTLRLSFNNAFGYFIEVSKANTKNVPDDYQRKQTLTNAERYTTPTLKTQEAQVLDAQGRQFELEYQLFLDLRQKLQPYAAVLKDCAHRVAVLDALQSLATVAVENGYTKPTVDDSYELNIQDGRHPVVEKMLPMGRFVANNCVLSSAEKEYKIPQLMMITGPNMAGKSTYMRQVALLVLMAQMGSFVPASYVRIGLVDSIFTRVGAVDDLSAGQSTFMVEMNETAQILHGATQHSLVILDEIGRGTSTYDGVSIAWSVSEYLVSHLQARTLFATHYHELNVLENKHPKIQNFRVCVDERDDGGHGEIEFLHKVEPGAAQKSYGIQVARMAGLPGEVVQKASQLLNTLQKRELATIQKPSKTSRYTPGINGTSIPDGPAETPQLTLFSP